MNIIERKASANFEFNESPPRPHTSFQSSSTRSINLPTNSALDFDSKSDHQSLLPVNHVIPSFSSEPHSSDSPHLNIDANPHKHPLPIDFIHPRTKPTFYLPPLLSPLSPNNNESFSSSGTTDISALSSSSSFPIPALSPSIPRSERTSETQLPPLVARTIDPASLSLHKALHGFHPLSEKYAEMDYDEGFNWKELRLDVAMEREW